MSDVLFPGQKWVNDGYEAQVTIEKVNSDNATFAATYTILRRDVYSVFPIRGEYDPAGVSIGWIVSYRNEYTNDNALGAWAGYTVTEDEGTVIYTTRLITHQGDPADTTVGFDRWTTHE